MEKFKKNQGFTLIELLVVIVIIGILASLAIPKFKGAVDKAKIAEFKPILKQAIVLYNAYSQEHDTYITATGNIINGNRETGFDLPEGETRFEYSSIESDTGVVVIAKLKKSLGGFKAGEGADLNHKMQKNTVVKDIPW